MGFFSRRHVIVIGTFAVLMMMGVTSLLLPHGLRSLTGQVPDPVYARLGLDTPSLSMEEDYPGGYGYFYVYLVEADGTTPVAAPEDVYVAVTFQDGTATIPVDFNVVEDSDPPDIQDWGCDSNTGVPVLSGDTFGRCRVILVDDALVEGNETIGVSIVDPPLASDLNPDPAVIVTDTDHDTATIIILENDVSGCGDGIIVGPETCDDGNATAGDGCDASCLTESAYDCTGTPSTCIPECPNCVCDPDTVFTMTVSGIYAGATDTTDVCEIDTCSGDNIDDGDGGFGYNGTWYLNYGNGSDSCQWPGGLDSCEEGFAYVKWVLDVDDGAIYPNLSLGDGSYVLTSNGGVFQCEEGAVNEFTYSGTPVDCDGYGDNVITVVPGGNPGDLNLNPNMCSGPSAPGTPDMTALTDLGSSSTDNLTSDDTPDFTISCTSGNTVTLYDNVTSVGTGVCASSTVTITASTLTEGTHATINATQTDGSESVPSSNLSIVIDTTNPSGTGTPDMTAGTDSGSSSTDDITSDTTPDFTVSCTSGTTVKIYDDVSLIGTGACSGGTVTITASTLSEGTHASINAKETDAAGNSGSASSNLSIVIDATAPSVSTLSPADGAGTVALAADLVMTFNEAVSAVAAKNIILYRSTGTAVQTMAANGARVTVSSATVTVDPTSNLIDGYSYYVLMDAGSFTDAAGNVSAAISLSTTWNFTATSTCGNGAIGGAEACDDGDADDGDGCSGSCTIESGWSCSGEPSSCSTICGDGDVAGTEGCDDGGTTSGNGCSATCTVESGYTCTGEPSVCTGICGDGVQQYNEQCDLSAGNGTYGAACSLACTARYCGNGTTEADLQETCDDGNTVNTDGCSNVCTVPQPPPPPPPTSSANSTSNSASSCGLTGGWDKNTVTGIWDWIWTSTCPFSSSSSVSTSSVSSSMSSSSPPSASSSSSSSPPPASSSSSSPSASSSSSSSCIANTRVWNGTRLVPACTSSSSSSGPRLVYCYDSVKGRGIHPNGNLVVGVPPMQPADTCVRWQGGLKPVVYYVAPASPFIVRYCTNVARACYTVETLPVGTSTACDPARPDIGGIPAPRCL